MKKQPNILNDILNKGLCPWLSRNNPDEVFAEKFRSLKEYTSQQPLQYQIEFHRPFDHKTKYYSRLILNTVKSEYDKYYHIIDEDRNENHIYYWINRILTKQLQTN